MGPHRCSYLCQHPKNHPPLSPRFLRVLKRFCPIAIVKGDCPTKVGEFLRRWKGLGIDLELDPTCLKTAL